jgi:four helix bundle protein
VEAWRREDKVGDFGMLDRMSTRVQRIEDLIAWQKARQFRKDVCALTRTPPFRRDFNLADQMRRASLSIMSNIAEGFGRSGQREFHRFLSTSKGSCSETRSHFYAALDDSIVSQEQLDEFLPRLDEVERIVAALRAAVARNIANEA